MITGTGIPQWSRGSSSTDCPPYRLAIYVNSERALIWRCTLSFLLLLLLSRWRDVRWLGAGNPTGKAVPTDIVKHLLIVFVPTCDSHTTGQRCLVSSPISAAVFRLLQALWPAIWHPHCPLMRI